jgi:PEP-CTERM motif
MTRIKTAVSVLFVGVMALAASESTEAALIDRGNGLIYDNVLDVTWAQDTALSQTLGGAGIFNWRGAKAWADQLVYRGYDDWRLPTLTPINGVKFNRTFHCDGSADYGYGIAAPGGASAGFTGNELAYMYHVNLGNKSQCTGDGPYSAGKQWGPNVGVQNASFVDALTHETVSFLHLQDTMRLFWFDLAPPPSDFTWAFKYNGFNDWAAASIRARAWAVRDGDVLAVCDVNDGIVCADAARTSVATVPEPSTLLLLFGLIPSLGFLRKRKKLGKVSPDRREGFC